MAKQKKILDYALDFIKRNKEGAIIGAAIGLMLAFFPPLFPLLLIATSYFTPFGWGRYHSQLVRIIIPLTFMVVGALIDQLIMPKR